MAENPKIKLHNNLHINFHNHISKPSYLITINPEKFLQKGNLNTAMSIKERNEINPELAEIVRKILLKRKKLKHKNNNHSFRKERKNDLLKKYFDDNYNKKQKIKENKNIILDNLNDKINNDNKSINSHFLDSNSNNRSANNKIKIIRKKRNEKNNSDLPRNNILLNYSSMPKKSKMILKNDDNNIKGIDTDYRGYKKLNKSLNLDIDDVFINDKIKIGRNNYLVNLNSITLDEDIINKDESILEINCDYSYNELIGNNNLIKKENSKSYKKQINLKKIKVNYIDDKNLGKEISTVKNSLNKNTDYNNIKKNLLNLNKKIFFGNIKFNNNNNSNSRPQNIIQSSQIKKNRNSKLILNNSQEHRNKNDINNNMSNQFNLTITNNFFKNNFNINTKKARLNNSTVKREKYAKNKNVYIYNKKSNINKKSYMKFQKIKNKNSNNIVTTNVKNKNSTFHSKNSSNLSTEKSYNISNKKNKINNINANNINIKETSNKIHSTKNNSVKNNIKNYNKDIQIDKIKIKNSNINNYNNINFQKLLSNESNKSIHKTKSISKKEYPNIAQIPKNINNFEIKYIKKIESLCKKGYSGPDIKKTNQDNFFIYNNFNNNSNYIYMGVCDGHGIFGQDISTYLVNHLPQNLDQKIISRNIKNLSTVNISLLSSIFQETFTETNISLNSDERIDSTYSGSTSVSLLFTPNRIFCINVGDSRCILGKYSEKENKWSYMNLSRDHKPSEPDEMARIKNCGGIVESFRDNSGNLVGPERVWNSDWNIGLAMSRSFGDEVGHKVGIVVDPEILEHFLEKEDKFIVLASDGIWEFISNEEVVDIIKDYYLENNIQSAIEHLYNEASKRWMMEEHVIDDITVLIIFLN